jgi:preprotein translocase subunit SecB
MKKETTTQETTPHQTITQIAIHRIYGKNQQFEVKGLPTQLQGAEWNPKIGLQANPRFITLASDQHEVVLAMQITLEQPETISFKVYLEQAGLFTLQNIPADQRETVLYGVCPNMLFNYAGVTLNQLLSNAGFPPVYLAPLDFIALYRQHQKEQQEKQQEETAATAAEIV